MSAIQFVSVDSDESGMRLDRWMRLRFPGLPQSRIERICRKGEIRVDGARAKTSTRLQAGQQLRLPPIKNSEPGREIARQKNRPIGSADADMLKKSIIFQDDALVAINKPPGLAAQGGTGQTRHVDMISSALQLPGQQKPRLVHRLDKETSGVLVMARTAQAARCLASMFRSREPQKLYLALVEGVPEPDIGTIDIPLGDSKLYQDRITPIERPGDPEKAFAKAAETRYAVVATVGKTAAMLVLSPLTGRTHQLRLHMALSGHPIIGDRRYGSRRAQFEFKVAEKKLHLHARSLEMRHPVNGTPLRLEASLPPHMEQMFTGMGWSLKRFDAAAANFAASFPKEGS